MEDHVELLGAILSADGSCAADTANRLKQGRKVWFKIHRQLGRLGFSQHEKYRVVASETRPFNTREMAEYQRFLNRCLRGVCLSEHFKMRDMKGHVYSAGPSEESGTEHGVDSVGPAEVELSWTFESVRSRSIGTPTRFWPARYRGWLTSRQ